MNPSIRLFFLGFLTLFLELVLIRYLAGNIWNLGFFPNLVLLAVFLGIGLGFVFHSSISEEVSPYFFIGSAFLLCLLLNFVIWFKPTLPGIEWSSSLLREEIFYSAQKPGQNSFLSFFIWFFSTLTIFALISQFTAKTFRKFAPLKAYTLDIAGSCLGILSFMLMSWKNIPPFIWFLILVPVYILILPRGIKNLLLILFPLILNITISYQQDENLLHPVSVPVQFEIGWSPYQRIESIRSNLGDQMITVNGMPHQNPKTKTVIETTFYKIPHDYRNKYQKLPPYKRVLVIGAGTGNDVASALLNGAEQVDALEIDPVIAAMGKKYHPARPYDDPRVHLVINDARTFMNNTKLKYDLVIFALTDSLVKISPLAQLRLENYIYTFESVKRAFSLLSPSGNILFYNDYRTEWLVQKMHALFFRATGHQPIPLWHRGNFWGFVVPRQSPQVNFPNDFAAISIPTDDWPFPYLKNPGIPSVYGGAMTFVMIGVLVLFILMSRKPNQNKVSDLKTDQDLFLRGAFMLMGTAFLLLETKSVIQFSLLFGTTWWNNSLVFLGILLFVLLANWIATLFKELRFGPILFLSLIGSAGLPLLFPLSKLLVIENGFFRFLAASVLTFSPIFFGNLLFSVAFRNQEAPEKLFGWNLMGAVLGGVAEYLSLWLGYRMLSILIILLYAAVYFSLRQAQKTRLGTIG